MEPKPEGRLERHGAVFREQAVVDHYHLRPPYPEEAIDVLAGLASVGAAVELGWFDWELLHARLAALLAGDGLLAVVHRDWLRDQGDLLGPIYRRHSWTADFAPLEAVSELERRGLFFRLGEHACAREPWRPTIDELVDVHFSASGLARSRVRDPEGFARELCDAIESTLEPRDRRYDLEGAAAIVRGRPG